MSDSIYQGDSALYRIMVKDNSGKVLNLTQLTAAVFTLKRSEYESTIYLRKTLGDGITVGNAVTGELRVKIDPEDTEDLSGPFVYDVEVIVAGEKYTILKDILLVPLGVTD